MCIRDRFSTGQRQVTDSFAAGADGATLNYTVAVPLFDQQKNITGCLFCAIYFDAVSYTHLDVYKRQAHRGTVPGGNGRGH